MIKKYRILWARLLFFGDLSIILVSWVFAYFFRFFLALIPAPKGIYSFSYHMSLSIIILTIWGLSLHFSGLYKFQRLTSRLRAFRKIFNASVIATLLFIASTYLFQEYRFSRGVIGYFFAISFSLLCCFRILFQALLSYLRLKGLNLRHIVIVGTGELARTTAKKIENRAETGIRIVGFVAVHQTAADIPVSPKIIGDLLMLPSLIKDLHLDQVIIALDANDYPALHSALSILKNETVDVKIVPEFYRFASLTYDIEDLDGLPFISLNDTPLDSWNVLLKRTLDILLGSFFLLLSFPVMTATALLIKIFSPGPILYSQERVGLDGKKIKIYKFRTMRMDAEKETGAVWAVEDDPRRTRIGMALRKFSLDELPQFLNVIKGDMSLVGPRPERPEFVSKFKDHYANYMLRHKVKAGLTGWAQINGWRGNTDLEKRIEHDLFYIKNWSAWFDLKIIWLTLWRGLFNKNAY